MSEYDLRFGGFVAQCLGITVTFFTAIIALRTSNNAYKALVLDKRPYLALDKIKIKAYNRPAHVGEFNIVSFLTTLHLKNLGKTIANFEIETFDVKVNENTATKVTFIDRDCKKNSRLLPGIDDIGYYLNINGMFYQFIEGEIDLTIIYYRDENEEKYEWKMKMKFSANLLSNRINFETIEDTERIIQSEGFINKTRKFIGI